MIIFTNWKILFSLKPVNFLFDVVTKLCKKAELVVCSQSNPSQTTLSPSIKTTTSNTNGRGLIRNKINFK